MAYLEANNQTRYWEDSHTPGLGLLVADFTTHEYAAHTHDALMIAVTEEGSSRIKAGCGPNRAHPAALLIVNPGEPHSSEMRESGRWRYRSFYFTPLTLESLSESLGIEALPEIGRNMIFDQELIDRFLRLHRALDVGTDRLEQRELLVGTIGHFVRRHASPRAKVPLAPTDRAMLRTAIGMMRDQYATQLTLGDLAAATGISQFQLIGLFRTHIGMTPHAYLTQVRLDAARTELSCGTSIAMAALGSGFYDQAALSKHFKRCYGITPRQFARATRS